MGATLHNGKIQEIQEELDTLALNTRFELGAEVTPLQEAFLDRHGFILFGQVANNAEVTQINDAVDRIQTQWLEEKRS